MREKGPKILRGVRPLSPEEARHRAFVASGKFDTARIKRSLNVGDSVVTRESNVVYRVNAIVKGGGDKEDEVMMTRASENGSSLHGKTRSLSEVCHADEYAKAIRGKSLQG